MDQPETHSRDERFVQELTKIVLDNLHNEQFSVEKLAETYGVSRSQLHKKLKKTSRKSGSQFIREIRLEEAMKLLQQDVATISEISYQVGFSSPTYFNTCFKDYFGYPPGEAKVRGHLNGEATAMDDPGDSANPRKRLILLFSAIGVLLLLMGIFYLFNRATAHPNLASEFNENEPIAPEQQTIAVLPLKNWSGDPELEYICDGITDAIILKLFRIGSINKVMPFASMVSYKETDKSIAEISKELGVKNILQGSFQLSGDQVLVKVQLIDGPTEDHFWEMEYHSIWQATDLFDMQATIAEDVASVLDAIITENEQLANREIPTTSKEAYNLYIQAKYRFREFSYQGILSSQDFYKRAIELDSTFIEPYIGLANNYLIAGLVWGMLPEEEAWSLSKSLYLKARALDQASGNYHRDHIQLGLNQGLYLFEWEWEPIVQSFMNAPDRTKIHLENGNNFFDIARKTGRHEDALAIAHKVLDAYLYHSHGYLNKAGSLFFLGRRDEAISVFEEHDTLFRDDYYYLMSTARFYHFLGLDDKSKGQMELFKEQFTDRPPIILWLNAIHAQNEGDIREVQKTLEKLQQRYNENTSGSPAWFTALYYCHIKDYDKAFEWLQKSYDRHEVEMTWLKEEPVLRPLHDDPRYLELYDKVGFTKILPLP